ncbi:gephyrin-like [Homarus americanus]|uniref:gephyrin-like n=1 Tax=Homarus americanus TaxID=6706 RepID=UPI001C463B79|nr:gephyrin-like [Homarus americanus]XP_042227811.1 gephyrin-like [Homarus americanus]XP_042227812.1 gephyrin-like [Homarus americanus]
MSEIIKVGVLTVSDRCAAGEAVDESGANLQALVASGTVYGGKVSKYMCIADELSLIKETLINWCDEEKLQLIITTGGTGFGPRDVTPEAVKKVIEREAPGLSTCMITESLKVTPLAMLSRPVCGSRGKTLIVTLPGSKKGSEECLRFIAPAVPHAVDLLMGWKTRVEKTHSALQAVGGHCEHIHHPRAHPHGHGLHHYHHHHHCHALGGEAENQESKADVSRISGRPRKSPYPMISVSEALSTVLSHAEQCANKTLPMQESLGFVLAQNIIAKDPLPPFPASIKDGYAVLASDGAGLRTVGGDSTAGCSPEKTRVSSGMCIRVNTGAPVPAGADAVVQVEDTELVKEDDDGRKELEIKILKVPNQGQDIRPLGCDIATGQKVLACGTLLGPAELGLLATVGVTEVLVVNKPTIAILSTGNELQEPGEPLREGHIRDSNKTTLMSLLRQYGYPVINAGIAKDDPTALLSSLKYAFSQADVLVTTGGVSMGERDILRPVLTTDFDAHIHFAQVFMKPGKPTTFATCQVNGRKKLILGLPGNPVSAVVTSTLYILPLCRKMSGRSDHMNTEIRAKLSESIQIDPRPEYHRATLCWHPGVDIPLAHSTGNQLSSRLLSLASAQALLKLPPATPEVKELAEGTVVDAILLEM